MHSEESPDAKFDRLKRLLQDTILKEYPNPERKGCPGTDVLQELAGRALQASVQDDPHWSHITHCAECYSEFLGFNAAIRRRSKARAARFTWAAATIAAVVILGVAITVNQTGFLTGDRHEKLLQFQARVVDLQGRSITRSPEAGQEAKPIVLGDEPEELMIRLPFGSDPGTYTVQILKTADRPLAAITGTAAIKDGATLLVARIDLSKLSKGAYFLGIRKAPADWTFYPVQIR